MTGPHTGSLKLASTRRGHWHWQSDESPKLPCCEAPATVTSSTAAAALAADAPTDAAAAAGPGLSDRDVRRRVGTAASAA